MLLDVTMKPIVCAFPLVSQRKKKKSLRKLTLFVFRNVTNKKEAPTELVSV